MAKTQASKRVRRTTPKQAMTARAPGNMCLGKYRYRTREAADVAIRQGAGNRSYRCPVCHWLHLTSKEKH